jgi:hypothetical protein
MSAQLITDLYGDVLEAYDWLGFHEYDWPTMDRLHNQGVADGNDGMWLALRYRRIMEPIINQLGANWSVVITECGMTQGVLAGQDVGFQYPDNTISGDWAGYPTPIPDDDYWRTLQWYSSELMKDDYVAGACMFVTGALSPWESFETIGTITPKIKDYQQIIGDDMALRILTPEELAEIESYQPPFRAQVATDIFVDDLRDENDPSLSVVPYIRTFDQLKEVFKLDVNLTLGYDKAKPGELYWRVIGFYLRTGTAAFIPKVLDVNGLPPNPGVVVFAHWPTAPNFPESVNPPYHQNAVGGFTNENGDIGFGYSGGAAIGPNGGVYDIWVSADPPTGSRFYSDAGIKLGWHGATDHLTPNPVLMAVEKEGDTTPPPVDGKPKLVVFDAQGNEVGYTELLTGAGSSGRIALFIDDAEIAHTPLVT